MIFVVVLCDAFTVFAALRLSQCHAPHRALSPPRTHTTYAEHTLDTGSTATDRQRHHVMEAELDVLQMTGIRMLHHFNKQLLTSCVACSYFCLHVCLFFFFPILFHFCLHVLSILSLNIVCSLLAVSPPLHPLCPSLHLAALRALRLVRRYYGRVRQLVAGQTAEGGRGSRSVSPAQAQRATTPEWKRKVRAGLRAEAEVAADLAVNGLRAGDTRGIAALAQARSLGLALGGNDPAHKYVVQLTRTPASSELPPPLQKRVCCSTARGAGSVKHARTAASPVDA